MGFELGLDLPLEVLPPQPTMVNIMPDKNNIAKLRTLPPLVNRFHFDARRQHVGKIGSANKCAHVSAGMHDQSRLMNHPGAAAVAVVAGVCKPIEILAQN